MKLSASFFSPNKGKDDSMENDKNTNNSFQSGGERKEGGISLGDGGKIKSLYKTASSGAGSFIQGELPDKLKNATSTISNRYKPPELPLYFSALSTDAKETITDVKNSNTLAAKLTSFLSLPG